ncbi:MAG: hypothetical protein DRN06_03290 [Thermoprotei archaeon]|nr:MAG: hypothetical protein DRN06_03290 [Thermoprotei archaeon]
MDTCNECGGLLICNDRKEWVCSSCGLVYTYEDYTPPIFVLQNEDRGGVESRQYVSPLRRLGLQALGSYVGYENSLGLLDPLGHPLNPRLREAFIKLKRLHDFQPRSGRSGSIVQGERALLRACSQLNVTNAVVRRALLLYRKAVKTQACSGLSRPSLAAACLFLATGTWKDSRPAGAKKLLTTFNALRYRVTFNSLSKAVVAVRKALGIKVAPRRHLDYVPYIVEELLSREEILGRFEEERVKLGEYKVKLIHLSQRLLQKLDRKLLGGRAPHILAAAAIYAASRLLSRQLNLKNFITQRVLSEVIGVAEFSIRDHYSKLFKQLSGRGYG